ncbi:Glycosyltransferase involved in cell wall bisynthesis [Psychroflexus salarius]|uniref:Glycosyltransferase involved in cell wall bisynthesis n=1 Tax=Psychroflexus salarius TaxID=1155689 RepID=A0A1M4V626_9FLAO|nr:glycosyltransferase family 4 protein [Psychroflexus salarius]SHE64441.1 Glycosyltransferase involved in cell wall bisynthesis [Psychroflexus salarius]
MRKKLILGVTVGGSSRLLDGQAKYFKDLGYEVYLISQDHFKEPIFCQKEGITHLPVKSLMADIHPLKDIKALFQIIKHFKKVKPDIVNLGTPKIALLGMLAAKLLGVKKRVYTCRGHRFETEMGFKRKILLMMEKLTVWCAHEVIYVSKSLKEKAKQNGLENPKKSNLIGLGSSNGVDVSAFNRDAISESDRNKLIEKYQLQNKLCIGFVGRVSLHKGAYELVEVFDKLYKKNKDIRLIMMGHRKCDPKFDDYIQNHQGIVLIPFQDNVPLYMSLFDIFVLPSWREGFPNVPIQAAAMGLPVVVSDATGCVDAVNLNVNGYIFKTKDKTSLYNMLNHLVYNQKERQLLGVEGEKWAQNFNQLNVWSGINKIYSK